MNTFQAASSAFLYKPIPDNWDELDEEEQNSFLTQYVWAPLAHNSSDELFDLIDSHCTTIDSLFKWTKVKDKLPPPNKPVILRQKTGYNDNTAIVVGKYVTDEKTDICYWPEGFYEQQVNRSDYSCIYIDEEVIEWMHLPGGE